MGGFINASLPRSIYAHSTRDFAHGGSSGDVSSSVADGSSHSDYATLPIDVFINGE